MAGTGDHPIVDWDGMVAQFKGREGSVIRIANTVLRTQGDAARQLRDLATNLDYPALSELAHNLKGMGGNLMAHRVLELGKALDEAAKQQSTAVGELAEALALAMEALMSELALRVQVSKS